MFTKVIKIFTTVLLLSLTTYLNTSAQSSSIQHSVSLDLETVINLSFGSNTASRRDFKFFNANQRNFGISRLFISELVVKSTKNWEVHIQAGAANFTKLSGSSTTPLPCSTIRFRKNNTGAAFIELSTAPQLLSNGLRGGSTKVGNRFGMDYQVRPGFDTGSGNYSIPVIFTISAI